MRFAFQTDNVWTGPIALTTICIAHGEKMTWQLFGRDSRQGLSANLLSVSKRSEFRVHSAAVSACVLVTAVRRHIAVAQMTMRYRSNAQFPDNY